MDMDSDDDEEEESDTDDDDDVPHVVQDRRQHLFYQMVALNML